MHEAFQMLSTYWIHCLSTGFAQKESYFIELLFVMWKELWLEHLT